ncbi:arsenic resistance protein [Ferviditalea candida]|uniref:Arsenic resistance protein n=1 Tax=Ferviditalea candida TaxID=3108399 RepID=A0ABU5ZFP1_9BACL|nr:arsenic resistance protein [Paenibacillaceae bacterium T2]
MKTKNGTRQIDLLNQLFFLPGKNLSLTIPVTILCGLLIGNAFDTQFLKSGILIGTFFMIFPTMIGFRLRSAFDLSHGKVVLLSLLINFLAIPLIAALMGGALFTSPELFAGLAISALLPTSGMTISWTMLSKGNVEAAVKMTALSLIVGSLAAPVYLKWMIGSAIVFDMLQIFQTILVIVFLPMLAGQAATVFLLKRYGKETFAKQIKPILPAVSTWAMIFVIFSSISMKAPIFSNHPEQILYILIIVVFFYGLNFLISTFIGRWLLERRDALALVYGTALRNLSIALGIAVAAFGPSAALTVTLSFIVQVQFAAWFGKAADRFHFFGKGA